MIDSIKCFGQLCIKELAVSSGIDHAFSLPYEDTRAKLVKYPAWKQNWLGNKTSNYQDDLKEALKTIFHYFAEQ